jgi:flagellar protein FliS
MNPANPWKSYRQVATQTASPGQLILMLYDGAIRFLEQSRAGFGLEDPAEFNATISNNLIKAQAIIHELYCCLNFKQGGQIATELGRLYDYFDRRLTESNVKKSPEGIEEVVARLTTLRDAWAQMLQNQPAAAAPANETGGVLAAA